MHIQSKMYYTCTKDEFFWCFYWFHCGVSTVYVHSVCLLASLFLGGFSGLWYKWYLFIDWTGLTKQTYLLGKCNTKMFMKKQYKEHSQIQYTISLLHSFLSSNCLFNIQIYVYMYYIYIYGHSFAFSNIQMLLRSYSIFISNNLTT